MWAATASDYYRLSQLVLFSFLKLLIIFLIDPLPPPTNVTATAPLAKSLYLEWQQSDGAGAVESYEINYCFTINECRDDNESNPRCYNVSMIDGSQRSYNITDSSDHPVEEDSTYNVTLTAVNSVALSEAATPSESSIVTSTACRCA